MVPVRITESWNTGPGVQFLGQITGLVQCSGKPQMGWMRYWRGSVAGVRGGDQNRQSALELTYPKATSLNQHPRISRTHSAGPFPSRLGDPCRPGILSVIPRLICMNRRKMGLNRSMAQTELPPVVVVPKRSYFGSRRQQDTNEYAVYRDYASVAVHLDS